MLNWTLNFVQPFILYWSLVNWTFNFYGSLSLWETDVLLLQK